MIEYIQNIEEKFLFMMLMDNDIIKWIEPRFKKVWLIKELNQITYVHILECYKEYEKVDLPLLSESSSLDLVRNLIVKGEDIISTASYKAYFKVIKKRYNKRALKSVLDESKDEHPADIIQRLSKLSLRDETPVDFSEVAKEGIKKIEEQQGKRMEFPTGIDIIDSKVELERGQVMVLGADTSSGKTALLTSMLWCLTSFKKRVLYVDLQMGQGGITKRIIKLLSGVDVYGFHGHHLSGEEIKKVQKSYETVRNWDLWIRTYPTCNDILTGITELNPDLVIVDYIQQLSAPSMNDGRTNEVGKIARTLEQITIQTNVAMIVASQFSRGSVGIKTKPTLHSFLESGNIEQCSRVALLMYRGWLYNKNANPKVIDLSIAKNSNGALGSGQLHLNPETLLISDYEYEN